MGLGGHPTSTDGFILGPSHGTVGRLLNCFSLFSPRAFETGNRKPETALRLLLNLSCNKISG
jgi:hypothetical protein